MQEVVDADIDAIDNQYDNSVFLSMIIVQMIIICL